jgi:hypothetical protein
MRNIGAVIDQMLAVIPEDDGNTLILDLNDIMGSVRYSAPEMIGMWWNELTMVINEHLPDPDECNHWQMQVGMILMDKI